MPLRGVEKATILLSILGADASEKILSFLPENVADLLASSVNNLPKPSPETLRTVIAECREFLTHQQGPTRPAMEGVSREPAVVRGKPLSARETLSRVPGRALIPILLKERPQTIALVLKELSEPRAAEVLSYLPEQRREVEYLLNTIKLNPMTEKVRDNVLQGVVSRLS
jgi:flagellar motor switch protein FliG